MALEIDFGDFFRSFARQIEAIRKFLTLKPSQKFFKLMLRDFVIELRFFGMIFDLIESFLDLFAASIFIFWSANL